MGYYIPPNKRFYKVAFSFTSGKDDVNRNFVRKVAEALRDTHQVPQELIFFDEWVGMEGANFRFPEVYGKRSEYIVPFFCENYNKNNWTKIEGRTIQIVRNNTADRVIPARFDKITNIIGFDEDADLFIDCFSKSDDEAKSVATKIFNKINQLDGLIKLTHVNDIVHKLNNQQIKFGIKYIELRDIFNNYNKDDFNFQELKIRIDSWQAANNPFVSTQLEQNLAEVLDYVWKYSEENNDVHILFRFLCALYDSKTLKNTHLKTLKDIIIFACQKLDIEFPCIPPKEVVVQGNRAVVTYFKDLETQGAKTLNEAKLIIMGEPEAGKTTLMECLLKPDYQLSDDSQSTLGIDVREGWQFAMPVTELNNNNKPEQFSANIWDFGGQQIQYMTHQFFLTPSALYVLVSANDRKEPTNFPYWFKIIHLLGEEQGRYSPVLVVLNEKNQQQKFNFDLKMYQDRYPELTIQECRVDLSKRDSQTNHDSRYQVLLETIKNQLIALPHTQEPRPARWGAIRQALRECAKQKNHISFTEYAAICAKYEVTALDSQKVLSGYLHRVGSLLYFADDPILRDFIILKPQWAVDAVYSVLVDNEIERNHGEFNWQKLQSIWQDYSYDEQNKLLSLMKQDNFEICYELDGKPHHFIAPQLLSNIQADYDWQCGELHDPEIDPCLRFRFQYAFMPEGIITRLIVRLNQLIEKQQDTNNELVWRKGMVLKDDKGCRAQVIEEDTREGLKVIDITVTGNRNEAKYLLRRIRDEVQAIHQKWFKNSAVEQMIPCICEECRRAGQTKPNYFKLSDLERARDHGIPTERCNKRFLDVSIMGLLEGVFEKGEREMSGKDGGIGTTQHFHGDTYIGAQSIGERSQAKGKITIHQADKKAISELQESIKALMEQVGNHEADFKIKNAVYNELQEINTHLSTLAKNPESLSVEDKSKLSSFFMGVKDRTLGAVKLANDLKEGSEAVAWVAEKAIQVAPIIAAISS